MTPRKTKFIWALFLIDVALCIIVWDFFPLSYPIAGGAVVTPLHALGHVLSLCSGIVLTSIGVFLIVDAFYKWPLKD